MRNEADFKKIFCKSIKEDGGFTMKLAAPMFGGIPDIYCIYKGFMPVMLEAKWLGEVASPFNRKIPFSDLQKHWLEECNKTQPHSAFGLVALIQGPLTYAVLTDYTTTHINSAFKDEFPYCIYSSEDKRFDVRSLFKHSSIPMMKMQHVKDLHRTIDYDIIGVNDNSGKRKTSKLKAAVGD